MRDNTDEEEEKTLAFCSASCQSSIFLARSATEILSQASGLTIPPDFSAYVLPADDIAQGLAGCFGALPLMSSEIEISGDGGKREQGERYR